jgi:hypothetical protein
MTVTETTITNINDNLWQFVAPQSLLCWFVCLFFHSSFLLSNYILLFTSRERAIIANRLAYDGQSWSSTFVRYHSGTYNNQWMVIDFKQFDFVKTSINENLLWITEMRPGGFKSEDATSILVNASYWPSYNIPYFPDINEALGYKKAAALYGNMFSYDYSPRALFFKRDQVGIVTVDELKEVIRKNNWKSDPFANGLPAVALASRFDLGDGPDTGSPYDFWWAKMAGGTTDAKIISCKVNGVICAISGPPVNPDCPVFSWNPLWTNVPHNGIPQSFNFTWQTFTITLN